MIVVTNGVARHISVGKPSNLSLHPVAFGRKPVIAVR